MIKNYILRNGVELPWISYGTGVIWKYSRKKSLFLKTNGIKILWSIKHFKLDRELYGNIHSSRILKDAYNAGFRMFDTGRIYGYSEKEIGKNVAEYSDVFITTKCSAMDITRQYSPNDVEGNLLMSLSNLKRKQADLYLLHWPEGDWLNYYAQIIETYKLGKCRAFGACNLQLEHLNQIESAGLDLPMVIQTEIHPLCVRKELRKYCKSHGIQLMAHTSTARNIEMLCNSDTMKDLSQKYNKSSVQITLRWHYQNGIIPIVSTFSKQHMVDNLNIFDFVLTDDEMQKIDQLDQDYILLNSHGIDEPKYIYNV